MDIAAFRKIKRSGYRGNHLAYIVDEDEFGTWAFSPTATVVRFVEHDEALWTITHDPGFLRLIPRDTSAWWTPTWWPNHGAPMLYADAVTPITFADGTYEWVDLELDLRCPRDGVAAVEDEDEFDAAIAAGQITNDEAAAARDAISRLTLAFDARTPPFDDTGWRLLDKLGASGLAPLAAPDTA